MKYRYIDLFCGAGGLGEGFKQAGFGSAFHVDMDEWAIQTVILREIYHVCGKDKSEFYKILTENSDTPFDPKYLFTENEWLKLYEKVVGKVFCGKIDENYEHVLGEIKKSVKDEDHSIIVGGPPCQAYSLAKRSRMRAPTDDSDGKELKGKLLIKAEELNDNRVKQYLSDDRHILFETYLNIINEISPSAFVYENVPGILTAEKQMDKDQQKAKIIDLFKTDIGTKAKEYELLCVDEPKQISFLKDSEVHFNDFLVNASDYGVPQNRKRFIIIGIRKDLAKKGYKKLFESSINAHRVKKKTTVEDAIKNLPALSSNSGDNYFYKSDMEAGLESEFLQSLMDKDIPGVFNHFARSHMKEDLERYKYFSDFVLKNNRNATLYDLYFNNKDLLPDHESGSASKLFDKNGKKIGKYVDRFKVQAWDKPATTITAHISKDGHAFIHPDSLQNRSLTAREAARLQSFPDSYVFCGPRTEQFRQIGNAVPVKLAFIIAEGIKSILDADG